MHYRITYMDADLTKGTLGREFSKLSYVYHVTDSVLII